MNVRIGVGPASDRDRGTDRERARKLVIDFIACEGHGVCADLMPSHVELDQWGYPILSRHTVDPSDMREARRTIRACPELAMRLEELRKDHA